jgi:hypothetical protein
VQYQSGSPDGKYLLVSVGSALFRTEADGADPILITGSFFPFGNRSAIWTTDSLIAAVLSNGSTNALALFNANGASVANLSNPGASPIELYPGSTNDKLYWAGGTCTSAGICTTDSTWVSGPASSQPLTGFAGPALAPDGQTLVGADTASSDQSDLVFADANGTNPRPYPLPGSQLLDFAWNPTGGQVAAIVDIVDGYSGKVTGNRNFLVDPQTQAISEYATSKLLHPYLLWSPDGSSLAWIGTLPTDTGFAIGGSLVDKSSKRVSDLEDALGQSSQDYLVVTNADWLPMP